MILKLGVVLIFVLQIVNCNTSADNSYQNLEEDGSISYLPNPSLSKEKSSITQVYYYLPVDEDSNEASNYQTKSSYFENHSDASDPSDADEDLKIKRKNEIQRTISLTLQSLTNAIFPYIFVLLPLAMIIVVIFSLFVIANSGTVPWKARQLQDNSLTLNEMSTSAFNAIQTAVEKYGNLETSKKFRQDVMSPEDVAEELATVLGFITLVANGGTVNFFDTFKKNSSKIRKRRADSDLDEKFGSMAELQAWIDSHLNRFASALTSEECMELTACQLGVAAANIPRKELFFGVIDWLSPKNDGLFGGNRLDIMKKAAAGDLDKNSCSQYTCQQPISHDVVVEKDESTAVN